MGFTLLELETTVIQLPRASDGAFATPNSAVVHRACRWACERFLRETRCSRGVGSKAIADGDSSIDTSTVTDFEPGCLIGRPWITANNRRLTVVDLNTILDRRGPSAAEGQPRLICWNTREAAEIYPTSDAAYTLKWVYYKPNIAFTPGATGSGVTIDIPARYIGDVALGALSYLMMDFPGQNARGSLLLFEQAIRKARSEVSAKPIYLGGPDSQNEDVDFEQYV